MKAVKININVHKETAKSVIDDLMALGIRQVFTEVGRSSILDKNSSFTNFFKRQALVTYPIEILSFIVDEADEISVLSYIAKKYDLKAPGKGSIYSYDIDILHQHPEYSLNRDIHFSMKKTESFFHQLVGII
jgi:hypothetical protein